MQSQTITDQLNKSFKAARIELTKLTESVQADNNRLRTVLMSILDSQKLSDIHIIAADSLLMSPVETVRNLEAEFKQLYSNQLTPAMDAIIRQVHDQAGKDSDVTKDIGITISTVQYDSLCSEEKFRDLGRDMGFNVSDG